MCALRDEALEALLGMRNGVASRNADDVEAMLARRFRKRILKCGSVVQKSRLA
jgi:hypothetical protein